MDPELFQRMQEAAARFNSGESDFEVIMTPAGPAHLVRDASDPRGFRLEFVGEGAKRQVPIQEYPPAERRAAGYPAPLPFLPNCSAIVNTIDQSVTWVGPEDPTVAFEHVVREMREDGWRPVDSEEEGQAFERDGVVRTLRMGEAFGDVRLVLHEERTPTGS